MELVENKIFDENMLYESILHCCLNVSNLIKENGEEAEKEKYVSKMYGNAFALLLRNGFICAKDESEDIVKYNMNINGTVYTCEESLLKNILFRDFDSVMQETLQK